MIKQLFLIRSRGGHFANVTHIKLVQFALKTFTTRNMLNSIIMFSFTTYICMYGYERELDIDVHMYICSLLGWNSRTVLLVYRTLHIEELVCRDRESQLDRWQGEWEVYTDTHICMLLEWERVSNARHRTMLISLFKLGMCCEL